MNYIDNNNNIYKIFKLKKRNILYVIYMSYKLK